MQYNKYFTRIIFLKLFISQKTVNMSLIIRNANHAQTKKLYFSKDVPDVSFTRPEKKNNGSFWVPVTVQAIPAPNFVRWSIKENTCDAFVPIDENLEEFKGTSNTLPHPVLVVQPSNDLNNYCFQIEVHNFIGSCKKILSGKKICYFSS